MSLFQALLIAISLSSIYASDFFVIEDIKHKYNVTEDWEIVRHIHTSYPLVIKVKDILVHVLDSNDINHAIQLESDDFDVCKVPLKLAYPKRYPRQATSLNNGKVVVWLLNYQLTNYKHVGEWRFVIVEPWNCTYHKFVIPDVDSYLIDIVDVIAYENSLDVLLRPLRNGEPPITYVYRYTDNGKPLSSFNVSVIPDIDSYPFYQPNTIRLHPIKEYDPSEGFFYVQVNSESNSTAVKRLSSNFQIVTNITLPYSMFRDFRSGDYSVSHHNFTICNLNNENNSTFLHCLLFDDKLMQKKNVTLSHDNHTDFVESLKHLNARNLPGGQAVLLSFAMGINHDSGTPIYVQKIENDGRVSEPKRIGKVYCEIYSLKSFEMTDDTYCIAVSCDETLHTRCINLKDYF